MVAQSLLQYLEEMEERVVAELDAVYEQIAASRAARGATDPAPHRPEFVVQSSIRSTPRGTTTPRVAGGGTPRVGAPTPSAAGDTHHANEASLPKDDRITLQLQRT
jgi:hypothetical protein